MVKNTLLVFFFLFISVNIVFPQNSPDIGYDAQVDVTSLFFVNTLSGSFDVNFYDIDAENYLGVRLGLDYFNKGTPGGPEEGSPFTDIDLLGKLSISGKYAEVNLCPGFTIHSSTSKLNNNDNGLYLKAAGEIKLKLYKDYAGLILKVGLSKEAYGGLGIYFGFNSRDFGK